MSSLLDPTLTPDISSRGAKGSDSNVWWFEYIIYFQPTSWVTLYCPRRMSNWRLGKPNIYLNSHISWRGLRKSQHLVAICFIRLSIQSAFFPRDRNSCCRHPVRNVHNVQFYQWPMGSLCVTLLGDTQLLPRTYIYMETLYSRDVFFNCSRGVMVHVHFGYRGVPRYVNVTYIAEFHPDRYSILLRLCHPTL